MAWHNLEAGRHYSSDEVVRVCEKHIADGKVDNPPQKRGYVDVIRKCPHEVVVFSPFGSGWGCSPMNPNAWKTPKGGPI